jgi:transposase-like protein
MTKLEGKTTVATVKELFAAHPNGLKEIVGPAARGAGIGDDGGARNEKGERLPSRLGYRVGLLRPHLVTRLDKLELMVPRDRDGRFSTELFKRAARAPSGRR